MRPSSAARSAAWRAALLASALAISACGGAPQRDTFDLAGLDGGRALTRPLRTTLAVAEPQAIQPVNSDRIIIRTGPNEIANLAEAQWVDRLPRLVQSRLIEGFDVGRSTGSVVRPGEAAERILATEIRRFEIDVAREEAVVEISAKISGRARRGDRPRARLHRAGAGRALHWRRGHPSPRRSPRRDPSPDHPLDGGAGLTRFSRSSGWLAQTIGIARSAPSRVSRLGRGRTDHRTRPCGWRRSRCAASVQRKD